MKPEINEVDTETVLKEMLTNVVVEFIYLENAAQQVSCDIQTELDSIRVLLGSIQDKVNKL
jgi:hypothetical protein